MNRAATSKFEWKTLKLFNSFEERISLKQFSKSQRFCMLSSTCFSSFAFSLFLPSSSSNRGIICRYEYLMNFHKNKHVQTRMACRKTSAIFHISTHFSHYLCFSLSPSIALSKSSRTFSRFVKCKKYLFCGEEEGSERMGEKGENEQ